MISKLQMTILLIVMTIVAGNLERIRREPEIQVFGLPKKFLKSSNNGAIERFHLGTQLKVTSGENNANSDSVDSIRGEPTRTLIRTAPHQISPSNNDNVDSHLEIVSLPTDDSSIILSRRQRSINNNDQDGDDNNDAVELDDLEGAEAKIFRPLFVYRQQMAQRHAVKRSKTPIYGAYQYKPTVKKHQSHVKKGISY